MDIQHDNITVRRYFGLGPQRLIVGMEFLALEQRFCNQGLVNMSICT